MTAKSIIVINAFLNDIEMRYLFHFFRNWICIVNWLGFVVLLFGIDFVLCAVLIWMPFTPIFPDLA